MQQVGDKYEQLLRPLVKSKAPVVPFFSSVQMKILNEAGQCDAPYWRANLENPVLFASTVKCLLSARPQQQIFLEVGPHSALAGPMREILHDAERKEDVYLTALTRGKNCTQSVLKAAGELFLRHIPVDFTEVSSPGRVLTDMPLYQWQHDETCWYESRVSREWRLREFPHHGKCDSLNIITKPNEISLLVSNLPGCEILQRKDKFGLLGVGPKSDCLHRTHWGPYFRRKRPLSRVEKSPSIGRRSLGK